MGLFRILGQVVISCWIIPELKEHHEQICFISQLDIMSDLIRFRANIADRSIFYDDPEFDEMNRR